MDLRLRIQEINENELLKREGAIPLALLEELVEEIGEQSHSLNYDIQLTRQQQILFANGTLESTLTLECDRCLEAFDYLQKEDFKVTFSPESPDEVVAEDLLLSHDELDVGFYEGEWLDLLRLIEEQVLLGLPMKKVCREECLGICPNCGKNLNHTACECPPPEHTDNPFSQFIKDH